MTYEDIWSELESATTPSSSGYLIRRIRPDASCDLFLGITWPSKQRMLLLHFQSIYESLLGQLPRARGVEVGWGSVLGNNGATLQIALHEQRFAGMFSQLVE